MKLRKFAPIGALLAALVTGALARSAADFSLWWHVVAGGGGRSASAGYAVNGSIGQPATGGLSSSGYRLNAGFWYGIQETPSPTATPTPTTTRTHTPSPTASATPSATRTATVPPTSTSTPTQTPMASATPTATRTGTAPLTPTGTATPSQTPSATPTETSPPPAGTLRGRVTLERRASNAGAQVEVAGRTVFTGPTGEYTVADIPAGTYTLTIRRQSYLRTWRSVTVIAGQVQDLPEVTLLAGDVNQDDHIELADATLIGQAWNSVPDASHWDPRADITGDRQVNVLDMVAVQFNWDRVGPGPWPGSGSPGQ